MNEKTNSIVKWARGWLSGKPHFVIGDRYLLHWYILPRNRFLNIYLHKFLHDDEDRALHDHPWWFISLMVKGSYIEKTSRGSNHRTAPSVAFRRAQHAHRVVLHRRAESEIVIPCWTIVITGRVTRDWGFLCPQGWRHWREFTAQNDYGQVGKGCD